MRHPVDSPAWKTFDFRNRDFSEETRNIRLGLTSDGFNPFKSLNVHYSTWPVVLIPYKLCKTREISISEIRAKIVISITTL